MKKQKGQAMIEFVLIFPFFVVILMAVTVVGLLFIDQMTLANTSRDVARTASTVKIKPTDTDAVLIGKYNALASTYESELRSKKKFYFYDVQSIDVTMAQVIDPNDSVQAVVKLKTRNDDDAGTLLSWGGLQSIFIPDTLKTPSNTAVMRREDLRSTRSVDPTGN